MEDSIPEFRGTEDGLRGLAPVVSQAASVQNNPCATLVHSGNLPLAPRPH